MVKALIQGYIDGLEYMHKNPDKAAEIIGKAIGVSAAEVKEQLTGVYNMKPGEMSKVFAKGKDNHVAARQRRVDRGNPEGKRPDHDDPENRGHVR